MAVDTHVYRVSHRLGLVPRTANTPLKVEQHLLHDIPEEDIPNAHTGYCFTGAMFVKAHVPNVINVPLRKYVRNCSKGVNLNKGMSKNIMQAFLQKIAANNNREWFNDHKQEYLEAKEEFERVVDDAIKAIGTFDASIAHLTAKDCVYRFYRDTRFSKDKSPYKKHLGHISLRMAGKVFMAVIISMFSPDKVCSEAESIGYLPIFSRRYAMKSWETSTNG
jgi:hypothetical protein